MIGILICALCVFGDQMVAAGNTTSELAGPDEQARNVVGQFVTKLEAADARGMLAACDAPWFEYDHTLVRDGKSLDTLIRGAFALGLKAPDAVGFRKITAVVPYPIFRQRLLEKNGAAPDWLARLDSLQLGEQDRVVFAEWMYSFGLLVRVREGNARIVGLEQDLSAGAFADLAAAQVPYRWERDVVYGRKFGTTLTLDVVKPSAHANGAAIVLVVSGDFISAPLASTDDALFLEYVSRGYTVFAVGHGGLPQYTIPEMVADVHRAVRFIRFNAKRYEIDPDRIGITGSSSGGYLALMLGVADGKGPPFSSPIDPTAAPDPVEDASSRVAAVACLFPPTDWLNYGDQGQCVLDNPLFKAYPPIFALREPDPDTHGFRTVSDAGKRREMLKALSPANLVMPHSAPALIIHGELDPSVPVQQSREMVEKLKSAGVAAQLIVKSGSGHGWPWREERKDMILLADWFDRYLTKTPDGH